MPLSDPEQFVARIIELHGGHEAFFSLMHQRHAEFNAIWAQDSVRIGRVLRAHLAVEHFLTLHLQSSNPNLPPLQEARLSFSQKIDLLNTNDASIGFLKPGLKRLNQIRNRIAHKLSVDIQPEDRDAFMAVPLFKAMREEGIQHGEQAPGDPLSITEQFAMFAAGLLHSSAAPDAALWREAAQAQQTVQADGAAAGGAAD